MLIRFKAILFLVCLFHIANSNDFSNTHVGIGKSDITSVFIGVPFMGYASGSQIGEGLESRLYARAYMIRTGTHEYNYACFVNCDLGQVFVSVQQEVLSALARDKQMPMLNEDNLILAATHTHCSPGGYSGSVLFDISTNGFHQQVFDTVVNGIIESIRTAFKNLRVGTIEWAKISLENDVLEEAVENLAFPVRENELFSRLRVLDEPDKKFSVKDAISANRSPSPASENAERKSIQEFKNEQNDERVKENDARVLRFRSGSYILGVISWFAVHGTSQSSKNRLVSGDNKGYAEWACETDLREYNSKWKPDDEKEPPVPICAFPQTSSGDVSPNVGNLSEDDEYDGFVVGNHRLSMALNGQIQYEMIKPKVKTIQDDKWHSIKTNNMGGQGVFVDFASYSYSTKEEGIVKTCPAVIGTPMAAGTFDGKGIFFASQGESNKIVNLVSYITGSLSEEDKKCQGTKEPFLLTGIQNPPWTPQILPITVLRLDNQFAIVALPFEATTFAGYRVRKAVRNYLRSNDSNAIDQDIDVAVSTLANGYAGYLTTKEEYSIKPYQYYEGASTHFGKNQLGAVLDIVGKLLSGAKARNFQEVKPLPLSETRNNFLSYIPEIPSLPISDNLPFSCSLYGCTFGDVHASLIGRVREEGSVTTSEPYISVTWYSAHPLNNHENTKENGENNFSYCTVSVFHENNPEAANIFHEGDYNVHFLWRNELINKSFNTCKYYLRSLDDLKGQCISFSHQMFVSSWDWSWKTWGFEQSFTFVRTDVNQSICNVTSEFPEKEEAGRCSTYCFH